MDQAFLVNDLNPDLAGWYDRPEADVYLNHSNGWRESDPDAPPATSTTPATPPAGSPPPGTRSNPGDPADNETE